jgi:hypothetical protein
MLNSDQTGTVVFEMRRTDRITFSSGRVMMLTVQDPEYLQSISLKSKGAISQEPV